MRVLFIGGPAHGELREITNLGPVKIPKKYDFISPSPEEPIEPNYAVYDPKLLEFLGTKTYFMLAPKTGTYTILSAIMNADAYSTVGNYDKKE